MKARAIIVWQTSGQARAIPLDEFVADIERRRAAAGLLDVSRNIGTRRTASKRASLNAIEYTGGKW